MNNKNGFTLIELLVVLIVLSLIMVIAVPRVRSLIDESKKKALVTSGEAIVRKVKEGIVIDEIADEVYIIENGAFIGESLDLSGDLPDNGEIHVDENGNIGIAIINNNFCVKKGFTDDKVSITSNINSCYVIIPTPESCFLHETSSKEVTITGYKEECSRDVVIPKTISGKKVVAIGERAFEFILTPTFKVLD